MKEKFVSIKPVIAVLILGIILFIVRNFFGAFLPESWLEPMILGSSVSLCVALVLGAGSLGFHTRNAMSTYAVLSASGIIGIALFMGLEKVSWVHFNLDVFSYSALLIASSGLILWGVAIIVKEYLQKNASKAHRVSASLGGIFLVAMGVLVYFALHEPKHDLVVTVATYIVFGTIFSYVGMLVWMVFYDR